jgi:hypothetical protein
MSRLHFVAPNLHMLQTVRPTSYTYCENMVHGAIQSEVENHMSRSSLSSPERTAIPKSDVQILDQDFT